MLQIVLQILAIIGIVLLCLLGLLLLVIGLVLFVPIRYNVTGKKEQENMELLVRASWLFKIISFYFVYPDAGHNRLKVLGIPVVRIGKAQEEWEEKRNKKRMKRRAKKRKETSQEEAPLKEEVNTNEESVCKEEQTVSTEEKPKETESPEKEKQTEKAKESETGKKPEKLSWWEKILAKIKEILYKIKYTICKICDTLKKIHETKDYYVALFEEEETKQVIRRNKERIFKLLKKLKPKKLKAELLLGTGSPDTTGYVLAMYGMLYGVFGDTILITPDFEQAVLEGTFQAKGSIRAFTLLVAGLQVYMDKDLRTFIRKLKRED